VFVRCAGEGPPIVLVHGIGVAGRYLLPTARVLRERRRVYVPDLPGSGASETPPRALGVDGLARTLHALLDELGLERPPLLANSLGCQVAIALAAREPERVGPLVLVGPTVDRTRRTFPQQALALLRDMAREPPGLWAIAAVDYARYLPHRFLATAASALADRPEETIARVQSRVLVVRGEHDGFVTQEWAEELAARAPRGRAVTVPGTAHAVNYTSPQALARLTLDFLDEGE
jgi:2-hydroxy-6-oxonona-2,4-dienedioate hydrolase